MSSTQALQLTSNLIAILEGRAFSPLELPALEEYSLYSQNANFFHQEPLVSIMSPSGRLITLKPDATLSVAQAYTGDATQKVYYTDQICRLNRQSGEFVLFEQFGAEIIGPYDPFHDLELVDLVLDCLSALGNYVLDISHLGLVSALMEIPGLGALDKQAFMQALSTKSPHRISQLLSETNPSPDTGSGASSCVGAGTGISAGLDTAALLQKVFLSANRLPDALSLLDDLDIPQAKPAIEEIRLLADGLGEHAYDINLDLSVVGDLDYYSGLAFRGYLIDVPSAVLTGGRYDKLMKKMGKPGSAVGFAINMSLLGNHSPQTAADFITGRYTEKSRWSEILAWQRDMISHGKTVRLIGPTETAPAGAVIINIDGDCNEH